MGGSGIISATAMGLGINSVYIDNRSNQKLGAAAGFNKIVEQLRQEEKSAIEKAELKAAEAAEAKRMKEIKAAAKGNAFIQCFHSRRDLPKQIT